MNDELKYFAFLPNLKIMDFRMKHHIQFILTLFNYYKNDYKILINFFDKFPSYYIFYFLLFSNSDIQNNL